MPIKWDAFEEAMKSINEMHCIRKTLPADHAYTREIIVRIQNLERAMVTVAELYASY
jgi:hypothetical protein